MKIVFAMAAVAGVLYGFGVGTVVAVATPYLDADTGSVVWRCKVSPYNGNAYSMVCPTVVDGKVLVGNDYGAIYVISDISGNERTSSDEIDYQSKGLAHPSWIITFIAVAAAIAVAVIVYRH